MDDWLLGTTLRGSGVRGCGDVDVDCSPPKTRVIDPGVPELLRLECEGEDLCMNL